MMHSDAEFSSRGTTCRAWLYRPDRSPPNGARRPCVVMAHGFGGTRDAGLAPYAERFVAAGFAVLLFDYRHFGASDGKPRQLLSVRRQLEDYASAIAFARTLPDVDAQRVAVWGTSFSGGHALVTAAQVPGVAAAVAQCPMMDGLAAVRNITAYAGIGSLLRLTAHGLADLCLAPFGRTHCIPIIGKPGELAMMSSADADAGYRSIAPPHFRFDVAARIALTASLYRPVKSVSRVRCPVLIQICEDDSVAPVSASEEAARRLGPLAEVRRYPIGHFEPYLPPHFERSVSDQLEFLARHLHP